MDILKNDKVYMDNCFQTFTGWGNDAKLKMDFDKRARLPNWDNKWAEHFVPDEKVTNERFEKSYNQLLYIVKKELEIE